MQILQYSEGRWIVEGSKGKEYHVKQWGQVTEIGLDVVWACDCPGSIYGRECRHIKAVKDEIISKNDLKREV